MNDLDAAVIQTQIEANNIQQANRDTQAALSDLRDAVATLRTELAKWRFR